MKLSASILLFAQLAVVHARPLPFPEESCQKQKRDLTLGATFTAATAVGSFSALCGAVANVYNAAKGRTQEDKKIALDEKKLKETQRQHDDNHAMNSAKTQNDAAVAKVRLQHDMDTAAQNHDLAATKQSMFCSTPLMQD
jgi:hypothetical protein